MAFSVRVTGYAPAGEQLFDLEPPWWDQAELRQDPRMRSTVSDGYLDYDAELSAQETHALHEHFRPRATRRFRGRRLAEAHSADAAPA